MDNVTLVFNSSVNNTNFIESEIPYQENISVMGLIAMSTLFFLIGLVGVVGNALVVYIVFSDVKMRNSNTNILIVNLALADLAILLFGVPEIVQFMINKGWLLGSAMCKSQRAVLVAALYCTVMTLLALCVERSVQASFVTPSFTIFSHVLSTTTT